MVSQALIVSVAFADQPTRVVDKAQAPDYNLPTILVLGDSLSAAYGIDPEQGWVALLGQRLKEQGYHYQIINSSISGDTTSNGKSRLTSLLHQYKPVILILGLGSNDGLRGLSTQEMKKNLTEMVVMAKKNHAKVLLIGFLIPVNYGPEYRTKFELVYQEIAREQHLPEVPFLLAKVALDPNLMQEDGLHPNAKAQPIILDNVWRYLKPMVKERSAIAAATSSPLDSLK